MNIDLSADEDAKVERLARKWRCAKEEALRKLVTHGLLAYDIEVPWWRNFYLLGAPLLWNKSGKSKFVADLRQRFGNKPADDEESFKYIDVVNDRIISKGVGLLQFNAVLSVLLVWAFEHYTKSVLEHWALLLFLGCAVFSSLLMIVLMYTVWRKTGYDDAKFDLLVS